MELTKVISQRKSTRSFSNKSIDWRLVLEAIDAANQAPFAGNYNHLKFIIVEDARTIQELAKHSSQLWIHEAPIAIIVCSDDSHLESHYGERGRIYGKQQAGAAIENILLKLTDSGISSCWVGAFTDEIIKQIIGIPAHIQIEAIIPVGHGQDKEKRKQKRTLEATTFWEKWEQRRRTPIFKETQSFPVR